MATTRQEVDLDAFVSRQLELLDLERTAEEEQVRLRLRHGVS
jgi:hypothetical protein